MHADLRVVAWAPSQTGDSGAAARSVRILRRACARDRGPESGTVGSAYHHRPLSLEGTARDLRWMGQPPPTAGHRVPRGGEPRPQGAAEGAARPADQRSAPASRGEAPATRSPDPEADGDHRHTRHDPAVAPAADRPDVDAYIEAAKLGTVVG